MDQMFQHPRLQQALRKEYEEKYGKQKRIKPETADEKIDRLEVENETLKDKDFENERRKGADKLEYRQKLQSFRDQQKLKPRLKPKRKPSMFDKD